MFAEFHFRGHFWKGKIASMYEAVFGFLVRHHHENKTVKTRVIHEAWYTIAWQ